MPFEAFVHPYFKQSLQPGILISNTVVSSEEGLVTTSGVDDIAIVAAVEHSATETAYHAQDFLDMVVRILPVRN